MSFEPLLRLLGITDADLSQVIQFAPDRRISERGCCGHCDLQSILGTEAATCQLGVVDPPLRP